MTKEPLSKYVDVYGINANKITYLLYAELIPKIFTKLYSNELLVK